MDLIIELIKAIVEAFENRKKPQLETMPAEAFPDREIIPVPCRSLIWQNGSLHCLTMQLPEGLVA